MTDKQPDRAEREAFESWYNSYNPAHKSDKQRAKDAYAAALAAQAPQPAIPAPHECKTEAEKKAYAFGWWKALESNRAQAPQQAALAGPHPDDAAVDKFAAALKTKLAHARSKGRSGWDSAECTQQRLSDMLREHVEKGDPRDVANFCMFLWCRGEAIAAPQQEVQEPVLFVIPEQLAEFADAYYPRTGTYIPARKTSAGRFTQPLYTAQPAPSGDAESLLRDAREALWQPSNPEICKRIDNFLDAARKEGK